MTPSWNPATLHAVRRPADLRPRPMPEPVHAFLTALRRVPIGAWHRCAEACDWMVGADEPLAAPPAALGSATPEARRAWERLCAALGTMPGLAARIRCRVDDELSVCDGIASAGAAARMRVAAQLAAAALAARPLLAAHDFERLYAPFAWLVPPAPAS